MRPRYPFVCVEMVGEDGNAFSIMARCSSAIRRSKIAHLGLKDEFMKEAMEGDYDYLLATVIDFFTVDAEEEEAENWKDVSQHFLDQFGVKFNPNEDEHLNFIEARMPE